MLQIKDLQLKQIDGNVSIDIWINCFKIISFCCDLHTTTIYCFFRKIFFINIDSQTDQTIDHLNLQLGLKNGIDLVKFLSVSDFHMKITFFFLITCHAGLLSIVFLFESLQFLLSTQPEKKKVGILRRVCKIPNLCYKLAY